MDWPSEQRASSARRTTFAFGPCGNGAVGDELLEDPDEHQRLGRQVVFTSCPGAETLHDFVERAELHGEGPPRAVFAG
jgi:hypothetical protein